jgi:hypothetical protein
MSAFTNFLSGVTGGLFGTSAQLRDQQHANRMYVGNSYARAPKVGFLYFVQFNLNKAALVDPSWAGSQKYIDMVGLLVKRMDLPKFNIATETLNQYNRKTVVQTRLNYGNVNIEFHDDNSDITTNLWKNYYKFYYMDGLYGGKKEHPIEYSDTKYGVNDYRYGLRNIEEGRSIDPFFKSIDVYVLHQQNFTQMTLINPKIVSWEHDSVNQEEGTKIMSSKMTLAYEDVVYKQGKIKKKDASGAFTAKYYDKTPSPISVGGLGTNTLFGAGGAIAGANSVLNSFSEGNILGGLIQAKNLSRNLSAITKSSLKNEGYSILGGVLGGISQNGNQPGGLTQSIVQGVNQTGYGTSARIGVNLFSNKNTSVNGTTQATPRNITGGG